RFGARPRRPNHAVAAFAVPEHASAAVVICAEYPTCIRNEREAKHSVTADRPRRCRSLCVVPTKHPRFGARLREGIVTIIRKRLTKGSRHVKPPISSQN